MAKDHHFTLATISLAIIQLSLVHCQSFSLSNLTQQVYHCDNSLCLALHTEEYKKLTETVWKMHKRTQAPDDAKCEKAIFSAYTNNGEMVTFNITATIQTKEGVINTQPGPPRIFKSTRIRRGHARTFRTEEGLNTWTWCLLQFIPNVSYISQMCSTQGERSFAGIFSFYVNNKDDAEQAVQSISTSINNINLHLSTYSGECDFDPSGPQSGYGGFYTFGP